VSTRYTNSIALIISLVLVATSCGGTGAQASAADEVDSPLNELLGIPITDEDAMRVFEAQLTRDAEALISECMVAEGFEHVPRDPSAFGPANGQNEDSREYAQEFGLGIAALVEDAQFQPQDQDDPNIAYFESLTDRERQAYETALWGDDDAPGCEPRAYDEAFATIGVLDSFGNEIDALFREFQSDPRMVELQQEWARCMREGGFEYSSSGELFAEFADQVSRIASDPQSFVDPAAAGNSESSMGTPDGEVSVLGGSDLTTESQAILDAIAVDERAAAVASWDCTDREAEAEILRDFEQRFVDENGDEIANRIAELDG